MYKRFRSVLPFLLPGLLVILIFYVVPFFGGIRWSLRDGTFQNNYVGFDNYLQVWKNETFQMGLKNTLELSAICAPLLFLLSFVLAVLLNRIRPFGTFFRSSVLLPYLMPSSAVLIIFLLWFDFGGPINRLLVLMGGERIRFLEGFAVRLPVIMMFLWKNLGFCIVIFVAALQAIPDALYEYAALEGASFTRQAFSITLPLIVPSAFLVFILTWVNAFRIFKEVYFIVGAYPEDPEFIYTLQHYMTNMYTKLHYERVTTAGYIFAVIVFALFGLLFFLQRRAQRGLT